MNPYLSFPNGDCQAAFDLYQQVFGANAHDFTVTNSNGEAVSATITDGVLTFDFMALGLSDLVISAVNGAGETVSDTVRIRVAGEGAYTIAIMPDTQDYTSDAGINHTFYDMTQWLADNAPQGWRERSSSEAAFLKIQRDWFAKLVEGGDFAALAQSLAMQRQRNPQFLWKIHQFMILLIL